MNKITTLLWAATPSIRWGWGLLLAACLFGLTWTAGTRVTARGVNRQTANLTRGPYLQLGTPTSLRLRWRTDLATDSRVRFGAAPNALNATADNVAVTTEHTVTLTGLTPNTAYYYSIGATAGTVLAGGDANHTFVTAPAVGSTPPLRVWVLGDAGWAGVGLPAGQRAVRDAYYAFTGTQRTALWLMLGDNAYTNGTDTEYQAGLFDMYPSMLRQSVLWPAIGNHDTAGSTTPPPTLPYFQIFDLPQQAEAGGVASGTELYYSYNYANIHFVSLDAMVSARVPPSAMLTWLQNDLAQNTQDWLIAYWHHPPYSKGSHDSDTEANLIEMRANVLPILENYGVDLVLSGHSHAYERSFLIDGHYGFSPSFTNAMKKNGGDGRPGGNGAYTKPTRGPSAHEGAVYVVAGSSGITSGGPLNHPAIFTSLNQLGSLVLDINGNQLEAKFVRETGGVDDSFTIIKGTNPGTPPTITAQPAAQTACAGGNAAFSAAASGNPTPTVQWQVSTDGGANYSNVAGATATTLNLNGVGLALNGHRYRAVFTNAGGPATTNAALLTVNAATGVAAQPAGQTVCPGAPVTFAVTASGTGPFTYQWRKGGSNLPGANASSYSLAAASAGDAGAYDVLVTGICGSVTSQSATLTVNNAPNISAQPAAQNVCPGAPVSFSVTANGTGPLSYQWRKNNINVPGASGSSYSIAATTTNDAGAYDVVVTGACGSIVSNSASLTVKTPVGITAQPTTQSVCPGVPVTFAITASGTGPLTYQWRKNNANITGATGSSFAIAATTTNDAGAYDVVVTGACGSVVSNSASLTVKTPVSITAQPLSQTVCAGAPVTFAVTASGTGPLTYQWRKNSVTLPGATGSQYQSAAASVNDAGAYDVLVTGACGSVTSQAATLTVNSAPNVTAQPQAQAVCPGGNAAFTAAASGSPAPAVQWQASSNGGAQYQDIPGAQGTTLTINNITAAQSGTLYRAVFTNACGTATSAAAALTVHSFTLAPAAQNFAASGGSGAVTVTVAGACGWTATSNAPWLNITAGAAGGGAGTVNYSVSANTGPARSGTLSIAGQSFTVTQADGCTFAINPTSASFAVGGGSGAVNVTAGAGCAWMAASNAPWLTINSGGSGNGAGVIEYAVAANPGAARSGTLTIAGQTLTVTQALNCVTQPITLSPTTLPAGLAGASYNQLLQASGGTAPYSFALLAGALPPGLSLAADGLLSGTPGAAGAFNFTVSATAATGCAGTQAYTLNVACPTITVNPLTLPAGTTGAAYQQSFTQTGGTGALTYNVSAGQLPAGLTLAPNGPFGATLSGTPTQAGTAVFTIQAMDANGCAGARQYTLQINCPTITVNPATLPAGTAGTAYAQSFTQSGGSGAVAFAWQGATIPGLAFDPTSNTLAGTPTQSGSFNFNLTVTDAHGCAGLRGYTLTINCPLISITPVSLPGGVTSTPYSQQLTAAGGTVPYTFNLPSGTLPAGLTLSSAGLLTGAPTAAGTSSFTIQATDTHGCTVTQAFTLAVNCATLSLTPASLPNGQTGAPYNQLITAAGGAAPYQFSVTVGALPAGLTLSNAGALTGTPNVSGITLFSIRAVDANGCAAERQYQLSINCPAVSLQPALLPAGAQWTAYQQPLSASGGIAPYTFSLENGALPAGVTLANGLLTGTPGAPGSYSFTLKATDANGCAGARAYVLTVRAKAKKSDFDGDGKTDLANWTSAHGNWAVRNSSNNEAVNTAWGAGYAPYFDVIVPGDYDGDGKTDQAVWRGGDSTWYIRKSSDGQTLAQSWGASYAPYFDVPQPGDYDGDGKTDVAVWRPAAATFYVLKSSDGGVIAEAWGQQGDTPLAADYDGDGKCDFAIWRPGNGIWLIKNSSGGTQSAAWGAGYAPYFDVPVPADYDGDGKTDLAVWRGQDSVWYIRKSSDGGLLYAFWGASYAPYNDVPAPGDYDGDGKADVAVWRPTDQHWYVKRSSDGSFFGQPHGQSGDVPVPAHGVR